VVLIHTATQVCAIPSHVFLLGTRIVIFSATGYLALTMTTLDGEETEQRPTIFCCKPLVSAKKTGEERWAPLEENQCRFSVFRQLWGRSVARSRWDSLAPVQSVWKTLVFGLEELRRLRGNDVFWNYVAKLTVLNRDNFGKFGFKRSHALHVTYFPSLWREGPTWNKCTTLGGSSTKNWTLGVRLPMCGYIRGVKCTFPKIIYV